MNAGSKYDLVLMDIIMPNLDGVSATHLIRQFDHTPIIAMTSNIRSDDISMYFQHGIHQSTPELFTANTDPGMNDVLPKPFTKEGLLNMLEKHLGHLKKLPDGMDQIPPHTGSLPHSSVPASLKDDASPAQSPSTISNWQSPSQFSAISPTQGTASHQFMQPMHSAGAYSQEQSPITYQPPHTPIGGTHQVLHRRQISEIGGDEMESGAKRHRMYDSGGAMGMGQMGQGRTQ